jgi:hypothetical protein
MEQRVDKSAQSPSVGFLNSIQKSEVMKSHLSFPEIAAELKV